jgi:hypothetical protein
MNAQSYTGWYRLPRLPWQQGPSASTWSGAWLLLLDLLDRMSPPHVEAVVLPAGKEP